MAGGDGNDGKRSDPGPVSCAFQPSAPRTTLSAARSTSRLSRHAHQIEKVSPFLACPYNRAEVASQVTSPGPASRERLTSLVAQSDLTAPTAHLAMAQPCGLGGP